MERARSRRDRREALAPPKASERVADGVERAPEPLQGDHELELRQDGERHRLDPSGHDRASPVRFVACTGRAAPHAAAKEGAWSDGLAALTNEMRPTKTTEGIKLAGSLFVVWKGCPRHCSPVRSFLKLPPSVPERRDGTALGSARAGSEHVFAGRAGGGSHAATRTSTGRRSAVYIGCTEPAQPSRTTMHPSSRDIGGTANEASPVTEGLSCFWDALDRA